MSGLVGGLARHFDRLYGSEQGVQFAFAPGRVNLIGEHTDYNDGFVLPMAIDRYVGVAFRPRDDRTVRAYSPTFEERGQLDLDTLGPGQHRGWMGYVAGVAWAIQRAGWEVRGMDLIIEGQVPIGAGLSSSAALEMAVARAICETADIPWKPAEMALLGQTAEREYVGVSCGIMDQFASAVAAEGCALLLDCRSLLVELVPIPRDVAVVVMDTGVRRSLDGSAYNERYAQCQEAVRVIRGRRPQVRALRDVSPEMLMRFKKEMDPVVYNRAEHVVHETLRPGALARALDDGELAGAGRLMQESHRSLRDLYEVSSPELDAMVELASAHPACFGARLTGAGFGGCAIGLVSRDGLQDFLSTVEAAYRARHDSPASLFACEAAAGANVVQ